MQRLTTLKEECKDMVKEQEARMRSDMDQIISSRTFVQSKLRGT